MRTRPPVAASALPYITSHARPTVGRFVFGALGFAALAALSGVPAARAQQDPPGCTGSGLGINLFVDKAEAHIGDTLNYSVLVYNSPFPACKAGEVRAFIVTPDGV